MGYSEGVVLRVDHADAGISVLHVDDEPHFGDLVATFLERVDDRLDVETVGSATEGLDRLSESSVDCVVSDYDMPGMDGLEFLETVRAEYEDLPFVLFTGRGSEEIASEAISAGVTDYLRKGGGREQYELLANRIVNAVEQYRTTREVRDTEQRLLELAENTNDVLWMFTADWSELLFINSAYEDLFGRSLDNLREDPRDFLNGVHLEDRERAADAMDRLSGGESVDLEYRVNPGEDFERWAWVRGEPVVDDGEVVRVVGFARDVTDRRRDERRLEELHGATRRLMAAESPEDIAEITVDAANDILDLPITGCWLYDEDEHLLRPVASTERSRELVGEQPTYREGESLSWEAFETGETRIYADVSSEEGRFKGHTVVRSELILPLGEFGVVNVGSTEPGTFSEMDVSLAQVLASNAEAALVRAEREQRLQAERSFFRDALDTLDDVFYFVDASGELSRWNDRLVDVTGYSESEIAEMDPPEFFVPDDRAAVAEAIDTALETGFAQVEADVRTAEGERIPYEFTGSRLVDDEGELRGIVGIGRDVTERKNRERRLEQFAGIVSHDLRNPLNVARSRLELAREDVDNDHLDSVARAHERMETLMRTLLTLSHEGEGEIAVEPVDLRKVAEDSWESVVPEAAELVVESTGVVRADPTLIRQVFENLFRNSVEHAGSGPTVTVGTLDDGFYVADDSGVSESKRGRVFDSGYTDGSTGTGFDLAIVDQVADAHGWTVTLTASDAGGARFEFTGVEFDA